MVLCIFRTCGVYFLLFFSLTILNTFENGRDVEGGFKHLNGAWMFGDKGKVCARFDRVSIDWYLLC